MGCPTSLLNPRGKIGTLPGRDVALRPVLVQPGFSHSEIVFRMRGLSRQGDENSLNKPYMTDIIESCMEWRDWGLPLLGTHYYYVIILESREELWGQESNFILNKMDCKKISVSLACILHPAVAQWLVHSGSAVLPVLSPLCVEDWVC